MQNDELELWYLSTYTDDPHVSNDLWLWVGYETGQYHWITDVWEALTDITVHRFLNHATPTMLRRFARAYEKGVQDRI